MRDDGWQRCVRACQGTFDWPGGAYFVEEEAMIDRSCDKENGYSYQLSTTRMR